MERIRLSTLMLPVVIAALGLGPVVQEMRHRRRESELSRRLQLFDLALELERLGRTQEALVVRARLRERNADVK